MGETASSSRTADHVFVPGDAPRQPKPPEDGGHPSSSVSDNQPTVISHRDPLPVTPGSSDSARALRVGVQPGDRLGPFELLEFIGGGGMGRVFRAWDTDLARTVALKILPPEQAIDGETFQRFTNEARSAARLDHESVVRVYQVGEDCGLRYIAFEFIEGVDIRALVERHGPLSLPEAVSYTLQVAEALCHAAARDVVHRDVKPSNVLVTPDGRVKLIDLGLARLHRESGSAADLTASGVTLGTFDYISPEQARDPRHADTRSDVYSLGCAFFYMLAGRPPFPEGTVLQKLLQHQGDQPPDIREFRRDVPDEAVRVMRKMLAKDPRGRYQQPAELVEDLLTLAEHIGLRPQRRSATWLAVPRTTRVPFFQRHLPWLAPIVALVLIVVGLDVSWRLAERQSARGPGFAAAPRLPIADEPPAVDVETPKSPPSEEAPSAPGSPPGDADSPAAGETPAAESVPGEMPEPAVSPATAEGASPPETPERLPGRTGDEADSAGVGPLADRGELTLADAGSAGVRADTALAETVADPEVSNAEAAAANDKPSAERPGLLVVVDQPNGEHEFAGLRAACAAAKSGDVIELRYSGRRESRPISLSGVNVTIRCGKGYQPLVVFQPGEDNSPGAARTMIDVASGQLTLINLAFEFDVARELLAPDWALFETNGGQSIRLEGCSLSVRGAVGAPGQPAYHPDVAFFLARSAPGAVTPHGESQGRFPAGIELVDCIARGEATLLRVADGQPVDLVWRNGLLATSRRLLSIAGGASASHPQETVRLELRHVTAMAHAGLCQAVGTPQTPHLPKTVIEAYDSILIGMPEIALITQVGMPSVDAARDKITYHGERMFYEGVETFWEIQPQDPALPAETMTFVDWKQHWGTKNESHPSFNEVGWRALPDPGRPTHTHTPDDYALDDSTSNNAAIGSAGGDSDAGLQFDGLPLVPGPPLPAVAPSEEGSGESPSPAEPPTAAETAPE